MIITLSIFLMQTAQQEIELKKKMEKESSEEKVAPSPNKPAAQKVRRSLLRNVVD